MLQLNWHSMTIVTNQQANEMLKLFKTTKPTIGAFDTEANGLHITLSTPFVFQFGWIDPDMKNGYTYAVDIEKQPILSRAVITAWHKLAESLQIYLGHNVKFDLHMLTNLGIPYKHSNLSDTMFYIRYAHDMLTPANGGPPLALKTYTSRYIDHTAKDSEKELKSERSAIAKNMNLTLKQALANCGIPPDKFGARSYTLGVIQDIFKDPILTIDNIPEAIKTKYTNWKESQSSDIKHKITGLVESEFIPYNWLNREVLLKYAHKDIIYTIETYLKTEPSVKARKNEIGIQFENDLIIPLYEMERVGFKIDKEYLQQCQIKMRNYIKNRREILYTIAGKEITIGQHEEIKNIFFCEFDIELASTNSEVLDRLKSDLIHEGRNPEAVQFIDTIQELRTLEKWYSTYINRFLNDLTFTDRLYTTINQVGTVSGRVTSDFQQFPKNGINTVDGQELFCPRKMIKTSGGDYNAIVYLDYSQIELRFQAFYTILVGDPDLNLCRAYMPYRCIDNSGKAFDYNNYECITNWHKDWYLEEQPETRWKPVDVHGATTAKATGLDPSDPKFKKFRSEIGKRVNFAKNYGAQFGKIRQMFPEKSDEEIKRIDAAYYEAFPGVKMYHQYCYNRARESSHTANLFGIKYYGVNGHKLINMLIQGSSAYYLKWKIKELYDYCKLNNIKSRFQMNIHDELSWEYHKDDDPTVFFKIKEIMQAWPDTLVPIVAEMDVTTTTWSAKKGVSTLHELQDIISPRPIR